MTTDIKESIKVMAVFDRGVRPVRFKWRGRVYPVKGITHTWGSREGLSGILHFSVTDGSTLYEITYNTSTMDWTLEGVEA